VENQDSSIIRRVLDGDTGAFRLLMERYATRVFALVVRIVENSADAEEITQDAFMKAFGALGGFDGRSAFSSWLYRIAYNEAVSCTRRQRHHVATVDEAVLRDVSDSAVDVLLESDDPRLAALPEALERLTTEERALITFHYYEEMPLKDVARIMGISDSNAKVRLMRIRRKLYVLINEISPRYE